MFQFKYVFTHKIIIKLNKPGYLICLNICTHVTGWTFTNRLIKYTLLHDNNPFIINQHDLLGHICVLLKVSNIHSWILLTKTIYEHSRTF